MKRALAALVPGDAVDRWLLAAAAVFVLGSALLLPPVVAGDGGEYVQMTESLALHATPDLRARDVQSLTTAARRHGVEADPTDVLRGYFDARDGRKYCYHFWGHSLLAVPARLLLRLLGANPFRAFPLTNAVALVLVLGQVLRASGTSPAVRRALVLLAVTSPAAWFVMWAHTETLSFALVLLALVCRADVQPRAAVLSASLAAMQNPPVVWLVAWLGLDGLRRLLPSRSPRVLGGLVLAALPAALPFAFFYWKFGTPSLIARDTAGVQLVSLARVADLFLDLNLGLLPFVPVTLALFVVGVVRGARPPSALLAHPVVLLLMALTASVTANWNHGTSGPSRYTVWMLPLLIWPAATLAGQGRLLRALVVAAVVAQGVVVAARGGLRGTPDDLVHSYAARAVLDRAPAWYAPAPQVFWTRTNHDGAPPDAPVVYTSEGRCRKAMVRPEHLDALRERCGTAPGPEAWAPGSHDWKYVDY